ncbi:MAG: hypothetical protein HQL66_02975 [Magnetococcales bacterium]|nr:hypothetical protein [Magnetococcales bacterium]
MVSPSDSVASPTVEAKSQAESASAPPAAGKSPPTGQGGGGVQAAPAADKEGGAESTQPVARAVKERPADSVQPARIASSAAATAESGENAVKIKSPAEGEMAPPAPATRSGGDASGEVRSPSAGREVVVNAPAPTDSGTNIVAGRENAPGTLSHLTVTTDPEGASVRILNITPAYRPGMALAPGPYQIEVTQSGYIASRQWVNLGKSDLVVPITLEKPASTTCKLTVNTKPAGAKVQVLNIRARYRRGMELPAGKYHIHVSNPGYKTQEVWIDLGDEGPELTVPITLQPEE